MANINKIVRQFKLFVETSWPSVMSVFEENSEAENLLSDWLQANWELIVEASIFQGGSGYLEVYGDGADCNDPSSRVWMPEAVTTHRIFCRSGTGKSVKDFVTETHVEIDDLSFEHFVSWDGSLYSHSPPFEYVLMSNDKDIFIIQLDDISFDMKKD